MTICIECGRQWGSIAPSQIVCASCLPKEKELKFGDTAPRPFELKNEINALARRVEALESKETPDAE